MQMFSQSENNNEWQENSKFISKKQKVSLFCGNEQMNKWNKLGRIICIFQDNIQFEAIISILSFFLSVSPRFF